MMCSTQFANNKKYAIPYAVNSVSLNGSPSIAVIDSCCTLISVAKLKL